MSDSFQLPSPRQNVWTIDQTTGDNQFTRPWFLFMQGAFLRLGGSIGITTNDLAQYAAAEDFYSLIQSAEQSQELRSEINGLREQIAELRKAIQSIEQGTSL